MAVLGGGRCHRRGPRVTCPVPALSPVPLQLRPGAWPPRAGGVGPPGQPRAGPARDVSPRPAPRVLPLPLRQRLRPVPKSHVPQFLHRQRPVSVPPPPRPDPPTLTLTPPLLPQAWRRHDRHPVRPGRCCPHVPARRGRCPAPGWVSGGVCLASAPFPPPGPGQSPHRPEQPDPPPGPRRHQVSVRGMGRVRVSPGGGNCDPWQGGDTHAQPPCVSQASVEQQPPLREQGQPGR